MEENATPIYSFEGLKRLLTSKGFKVGKGEAYRPLEVKDVDLNSPLCDLQITSNGFYVIDPVDGVKRQVFLYMKNYRVSYYNRFPVYHICYCPTLKKYDRSYYRRANTAKVTVLDRDTGDEIQVDKLQLCQNCADMLYRPPKTTADFERIMRKAALNSENHAYKKEELDIYGYTKDWNKISEAYRNMMHFKCEECGVQIINPFDYQFIQVHHINGRKTDNRELNLKCLCIECHSLVDERHRQNFSTKAQQLMIQEFRRIYR
ncbi:MAG: hypothetical protein J5875_09150 [Paludibacteraceae bacterium]|nr:hypothetical protein [Paludibacteraceae bacterium]